MTEDPTTEGVAPDRLARLLRMARVDNSKQTDETDAQDTCESLADLLAAPLPVQDALVQSLPGIIQSVYKELIPCTDKPLAELLTDPATDLQIIKHVKAYTKQKVKSSLSTSERDAATVVYYAAIAHALVHHHQRITDLSSENLNQSLSELILNDWLETSLIDLFKAAISKCSDHE